MINCNYLLSKTGNPVIKNFDFGKRFGTVHVLLIDLFYYRRDSERDVYCTPKDLEPRSEFEESIAERIKLRRQKKSDEENQNRQKLQILTADQMLSRLPISLAHSKAGDNSEKLRKELR